MRNRSTGLRTVAASFPGRWTRWAGHTALRIRDGRGSTAPKSLMSEWRTADERPSRWPLWRCALKVERCESFLWASCHVPSCRSLEAGNNTRWYVDTELGQHLVAASRNSLDGPITGV